MSSSSYPTMFGRYDLIERINYGGMSEVFRAVNRDKGETVALKRILPTVEEDEEFVTLFEDEARIAQFLDHENIARIIDFGEVEASHYIAFEHVHGQPLRRLIERVDSAGEKLSIDMVVHVVAEVCRGLSYAHDRTDQNDKPLGIVHRDVSPHNVLISYEGQVKLIDFGIAKAIGKLSHTQTGSIKGKMGYMAPEQTLGQVDRRSDLFALGICLWEALTSERLFPGDNELLLVEQIRKRPIPPPSSANPLVPPELDRITLKALAKDPNQRYPSASDFEADLRALARSQGVQVDATRVAALMSRLFLAASASKTGQPAGQQEKRMSDKGGSDLDVFDGLAKKPRPSTPAPSSGPRPAPPPARQKTLLGLAAPAAPPPPIPNRSSAPAPGSPFAPPPAPSFGAPPGPSFGAPPGPSFGAPPGSPLGAPPGPSFGAPPGPPFGQIPTRPPPPPPKPSGPPGRTPTITGLAIPAPPPPVGSAPPGAAKPPSSSFPRPPAPIPSRSATPPPPSAPKPANAAPVDMDWDDEDEKTAVFEKSTHEDAARSLLRSAPPPAAGAPPPPLSAPPPSARVGGAAALLASSGGAAQALSRPPPSRPMPMSFPSHPAPPMSVPVPVPMPLPPPVSAPPRASIPSYPQQRSGGRTALLLIAVILVAGFAAALVMVLMPRKGSLVVTVAGPGNKAIDSVQILVNDAKKCDTSPCRVSNLESGTHMVKILAAGYQQTAAQAVKVQGGEDAVVNVTLAAASGTGVRVTADGAGLRLIVDDKDVGPLPQDLKDLTPGDHKFRIEGGDRYEPWDKTVTVEADKMVTLEPKLKVLKGIATIKAGQNAEGARVLLVSGTERRPIPALPIKIDITTNKSYTLVAHRPGFSEFRQDITFEDGNAEKTFVIDMTQAGEATQEPAPTPAPAPRPFAGGGVPRAQPAPRPLPIPAPAAEPAAATGQGTLNINSIPVSNVILDGKPLGATPKSGLKVSAGAHTVVFVHAEHGRKVRGVTVRPNETATAAVRFP